MLFPCYWIPLAQLRHRPEEFCRGQPGSLQHPVASTTSTAPAPARKGISLPWLLPQVIKEQKENKNKEKKTQQDLQALLAAVKTNATTKTCQKAGGGWPGPRWGAGKHGELACRQWEGAKYPHKQVSCLKLIYLLKQHSAKPVINIFLPRLLT